MLFSAADMDKRYSSIARRRPRCRISIRMDSMNSIGTIQDIKLWFLSLTCEQTVVPKSKSNFAKSVPAANLPWVFLVLILKF